MRRDIHVDNAPSVVRRHHEHKQRAEGGGGNREEVDRGELGDVIGEKGAPRLRRWVTPTPEVLRHGGLRHLDSELLQLAVDAWRSPERVRLAHLANQRPEVRCKRRPTDAAGSRRPAPIGSERAPMPTDDSSGRHDLYGAPPVRPDAREQHPDQPIDRTKAWPFRSGALEHGELMTECENFRRDLEPKADCGSKRGQQRDE